MRSWWRVVLCCTLLAELSDIESSTYLVPLVDATSRPLAAVLHLLELADRDGAECEELRTLAGSSARGQARRTPVIIAYGNKASKGTPMVAVGSRCGVVGVW
jgi:hypothetical protein